MIFALIAIPSSTATLIYSSAMIICLVQLAIIKVEHHFLRRPKIKYFQKKRGIVQLLLFLLTFVMMCFSYQPFIISTEDRNKEVSTLDVVYFIFVTLTTIGFGDFVQDHEAFVPENGDYGSSHIWAYFCVSISGYASLGLAASLINLMANLAPKKKKKIVNK